MTVLKLEGVVSFRDVPYLGGPESTYCPFIGDTDVIGAVLSTFQDDPRRVTVAIADERFDGYLHADHGSAGYSEYTPGDPAELFVVNPRGADALNPWFPSQGARGHEILGRLWRLEEQTITLWVADEPFNTLA